MNVLAVSDSVVEWIYSPRIRLLLSDIDLVIGCGDLPHYYLEYISNALDVPIFYVHGNHSIPDADENLGNHDPHGLIDLHRRVVRFNRFSFAGVEGCRRYNDAKYQYSQFDMWLHVFRLTPSLLRNQLRFGRYLDVFVSHAPAWGIQDEPDLPHQGIKAFRWLLTNFQPAYHLHGHVHIYRPDVKVEILFDKTRVINAYGYRKLEL